jgi:pimeloyl-ACP methyl ester carboxylesterase
MLLKTSLGSAYIHNIDLIDKSKEVILFIPGAGMDHRVANLFDLNPKIFNKVISIDLPGHGGSPPSDASTIEEYAKFISVCLKELNLTDFHLCGHSMGGLVCMSLASLNRKIFKSVSLFNCQYPLFVGSALLDDSSRNLDSAADFLTKYGIYKMPSIEKPKKAFGIKGSSFYKKTNGKVISPYGSKDIDDPEREIALYDLKKLFNQVSKDILAKDMNACMKYRMDLKDIKKLKDVNIIIGEMDKLVSPKKIDEMISMFGSAELKKMEGVAHFPFFEDPKVLNRTLEDVFSTYI